MDLMKRIDAFPAEKLDKAYQICFIGKNGVGGVIPFDLQIFKVTSDYFFHSHFRSLGPGFSMLKQPLQTN